MGLTVNGKKYAAYLLASGSKFALSTDGTTSISGNHYNDLDIVFLTNAPTDDQRNDTSKVYLYFDPSTEKLYNVNKFYFPDADGGNWGNVTHILIKKANVLYYSGQLSSPITINENDRPKFIANAFELDFSDNNN